jgi:hypothetical protein
MLGHAVTVMMHLSQPCSCPMQFIQDMNSVVSSFYQNLCYAFFAKKRMDEKEVFSAHLQVSSQV